MVATVVGGAAGTVSTAAGGSEAGREAGRSAVVRVAADVVARLASLVRLTRLTLSAGVGFGGGG
jgi:hypothetical protein